MLDDFCSARIDHTIRNFTASRPLVDFGRLLDKKYSHKEIVNGTMQKI